MNTAQKTSEHFNPINRDLAVVFTIGFVIAIAIVTTGIAVLNYL